MEKIFGILAARVETGYSKLRIRCNGGEFSGLITNDTQYFSPLADSL
jgi:hypothetical protein